MYLLPIYHKKIIDHQIFGSYHKYSQFNLEYPNNIFIVAETKIEEDRNKKLIVKLPNKKVELAKNLTQAECEWLLSEIKNCLENN